MLFTFSLNSLNFSLLSVTNVIGKQKINSENITRILDQLLEGYDNRLRPGSGGKHRNMNFVFAFCILLYFALTMMKLEQH